MPSGKGNRGPTKLSAIVHARSQATRFGVDVNEFGAPISEKAISFACFFGVQVRQLLKLTLFINMQQ